MIKFAMHIVNVLVLSGSGLFFDLIGLGCHALPPRGRQQRRPDPTMSLNNPGADRHSLPSPAPCSGAERRNKVLDEVSTAFHDGAAAVKERLYFTPQQQQ